MSGVAFALLLVFTACKSTTGAVVLEKENHVDFAVPQILCAGRMRITAPGPDASVDVSESEINSVQFSRTLRPNGSTFEEAWRAEGSKDLAIMRILRQSFPRPNQRLQVTTQNGLPASTPKSNVLEIWQDDSPYIIKGRFVGGDPDRMAGLEADVQNVIEHFRSQILGQLCSDVGFAVSGGTILPFASKGESVSAHLRVPLEDGLHDMVLNLFTEVLTGSSEDTLLTRMAQQTPKPGSHVMRSGSRTISFMQGHEYAYWYPRKDDPKHFVFFANFECGGTGLSITRPRFELSTSSALYPYTVDPKHLLSLWDAMLNSIKMTQ